MNFGAEKCFCLGACCEKPCWEESRCDDMWVFEKWGRCPEELGLAVRENSEFRVLLRARLGVLPGLTKLSRLDAGDLEVEKDLSPGKARARLSAEFAV